MAFTVTKLLPAVNHGNELQVALANLAHTSTYPTGGETVDLSGLNIPAGLGAILAIKGKLYTATKAFDVLGTKGADWTAFTFQVFDGGTEVTNGTTITSTGGLLEIYLGRRVA
jgi:hypothetical protein